MLTQMKRWGQIKQDVDYHKIAEQVFLVSEAGKAMRDLGLPVPDKLLQERDDHGEDLRSAANR